MADLENPVSTDTTEAEKAINDREVGNNLREIRDMVLAKFEAELTYTVASDEQEPRLTKGPDGVWRQELRY